MLTLTSSYEGLTIAFVVSLAIALLTTPQGWMRALIRSATVLGYLLPTFVGAEVGMMVGFRAMLPPILVAGSLALPMITIASDAFDAAEQRFPTLNARSRFHRFRLVGLRFALPELLAGCATCFPWAVLSSMLAEMATGGRGLGIFIFSARQNGMTYLISPCLLSAMISIIPYIVLSRVSNFLSSHFYLQYAPPPRGASRQKSKIRRSALMDLSITVLLASTSWLYLRLARPSLVPSLEHATRFIFTDVEFSAKSLDALGRTLVATLFSVIVGVFAGTASALVAFQSLLARKIVVALISPLQFLPLIVFVPFLAFLQKELDRINPYDPFAASFHFVPWISTLLPSVIVGSLVCTYVCFSLSSWRLMLLPHGIEGLLILTGRLSLRGIRYIYLPWLSGAVGLALELGLPRIFLAVFVSEYMVTNVGFGALLYGLRSRGDYLAEWCTLIIVVMLILAMFCLAETASDAYSRWLKTN